MGRVHKAGLLASLLILLQSINQAKLAITNLPAEYGKWKDDFLTFIGIRLGHYSYACAWYKQLQINAPNIREVCFISPDTHAFAAVNAGIHTRYIQHGLMRKSLIIPNFDQVEVITVEEQDYIRARLTGSEITLARKTSPPAYERDPHCILVASIYGSKEEMRLILPFLDFVVRLGMSIYVRPHPRENKTFWESCYFPFKVKLEDSDKSFDDAINRLRPLFVASWFSTAIVDSLYMSVIPVSVTPIDDMNVRDLVYPLFNHCLHWPSRRDELEDVISGKLSYESVLQDLRTGTR